MKTKLREEVFQALREASMCWSELPIGVFEAERAQKIGDKLIKKILSLAKECAPKEKKIIELDEDCTSTGNADDAYDHGMERGEIFGFNAGVKQFLANIEGEECIK